MRYYLFFLLSLTLFSCQEEITLDLPQSEVKLVVEGSIEPGFPPYVIFKKSEGYFDPINTTSIDNIFTDVDTVKVWCYSESGEMDTVRYLQKISITDTLPPIYTDVDYILSGAEKNYGFSKENKTYYLEVKWNNQTITAETTIPTATALDCLWVEKRETAEKDFKCDIRAIYSDPIDQQNNILIKSKRLQHFTFTQNECEIKDKPDDILQLVDAGSDILINGESFETYFPRPKENGFPTAAYNSLHTKECDNDSTVVFPEDIVLIKFCQIDEPAMKFWRGLVRQGGTNANPFAEPINLVSNINGGLGVWAGYSPTYYKVPIIEDIVVKDQYDSLTILDIF